MEHHVVLRAMTTTVDRMKICYLAVLIFGLGTAAFAQTNNLRGKVLYESHEGNDLAKGGVHEPEYVSLPGAYVRWSSAPENVEISDGFGFFKISSSHLGDTLLVSMVGVPNGRAGFFGPVIC